MCSSAVCGPMHLTGKLQLKITSLHQQRAPMWSSHQVTSRQNKKIVPPPSSGDHKQDKNNHQLLPLCPRPTTGAWVVLDSSPPPLNKLTVVGVLEIPDTMNSTSSRTARAAPEYSTLVLDAVYISIQVSVADDHFLDCTHFTECRRKWTNISG